MSKILTAALFIVTVDALGLTSPGLPASMAKRGETIKGEHLGDEENIQRLLALGAITHAPEEAATPAKGAPSASKDEPEAPAPEPEGPAARFALGLTLPEDFAWTDEAKAYVQDLKEGVIPVPFDADKVTDLTIKDLVKRIEAVTGEPYAQGSKKKMEVVQDLKTFMEGYVAGLLEGEKEDEEADTTDDLPEGWDVEEKDGFWTVIRVKGEERVPVKEGLDSRDDAVSEIAVLKAQEEGAL